MARFLLAIFAFLEGHFHMPAQQISQPSRHASTRRSRWLRSVPRWTFAVPVAIAAAVVLLVGFIAAFNQGASAVRPDQGFAEQILGVMAGESARVITLTGRSGASVRLVYDPVRRRGVLVVVRLADPGDDLAYRLWLIDRNRARAVATFVPSSDRATLVPVQADFGRYDAVVVTVGPRGRSSLSATPVLRATLASSETRSRPVRRHPLFRME